MIRLIFAAAVAANLAAAARAADTDLGELLATVRAVGPRAEGIRPATEAWRAISLQPATRLTEVLAGFEGASPLAENYLRAAVDAIAERTLAAGEKLPMAELEKFSLDGKQNGRARRLAYDWLVKVDATASDRIIPKMLGDPSLELRRDAVARVMEDAKKKLDAGDVKTAVAAFSTAFTSARDLDQIKACAEALKKQQETVDLPKHFGFVTKWRIIGPFDNTKQAAFDKAYLPESEYRLDAKYMGKTGEIGWIEYTTKDEYGVVDLTKALDKHKGAVAYAATEFNSSAAREGDLRIGCINAMKVWLNGELLGGRDVYHAGMEVNQYVYRGKLKAGRNFILIKVLQNEQTEEWAQNWQFQLRVCDAIGTAVRSEE